MHDMITRIEADLLDPQTQLTVTAVVSITEEQGFKDLILSQQDPEDDSEEVHLNIRLDKVGNQFFINGKAVNKRIARELIEFLTF